MSDYLGKFLEFLEAAGCAPARASDITDGCDGKLISAADDAKGQRSLYVSFRTDGDKASGRYYSCKLGHGEGWFSRSKSKWTQAERDAWKARADADRKQAEAERLATQEAMAAEAARIWKSANKLTAHPYLERKGIFINGLKEHHGNIILPLKDTAGKIWGLQTITPDGGKYNSFKLDSGEWAKGSRKQGCYYAIAKADSTLSTLIICEGLATAITVHLATDLPCIMAVDAGNLRPVAEALRIKYPNALIIVAADNDEKDGSNKGVEAGQAAAHAVHGHALWPDKPGKDWDDVRQEHGLEAVKDKIMAAIEASNLPPPAPPPPTIDNIVPAYNDDFDMVGDLGLPFKILGYGDNHYFYFPFGQQQIVKLTASGHTMNNLLQLATLHQWKERFGGTLSPSQLATHAADALFQQAHKRGVFQEESRVRGCGAWTDAGRIVIHCGDKLIVDGLEMQPKDIKGRYVYAASTRVLNPNRDPLPNSESIKLRHICEMPSWEMPLSGTLLAGWIVIAPICAALEWRPHIWITGEAEAGKSTVLNRIIRPVLGDIAVNLDGFTSESAIRGMMNYDARPVVFDEGNTKTAGQISSTMDGVLMLARLASSGGVIRKHGQNAFTARSCFCFSAVNPPINSFQDETRISMMSLRRNHGNDGQEHYRKLLLMIEETITPEYGRRLLSRTIANMPTLLKNIETFRAAARKVIKGARAADQVSAMLAGTYLLHSTQLITADKAEEWIRKYDWTEHTSIAAKTDPERLLHHLATSLVRVPWLQRDVSIGTLIVCALEKDETIDKDQARNLLKNYSISARPEGIDIGTKNHNMTRLLKETEWANNYKKMLQKLGGTEDRPYVYFGPADKQRAVRLPVKYFLDEPNNDVSKPQDEEYEIAF